MLGKGYLTVKSAKVTKVKLLKRLLAGMLPLNTLDFVLYVGEDESNEAAYRFIN